MISVRKTSTGVTSRAELFFDPSTTTTTLVLQRIDGKMVQRLKVATGTSRKIPETGGLSQGGYVLTLYHPKGERLVQRFIKG